MAFARRLLLRAPVTAPSSGATLSLHASEMTAVQVRMIADTEIKRWTTRKEESNLVGVQLNAHSVLLTGVSSYFSSTGHIGFLFPVTFGAIAAWHAGKEFVNASRSAEIADRWLAIKTKTTPMKYDEFIVDTPMRDEYNSLMALGGHL